MSVIVDLENKNYLQWFKSHYNFLPEEFKYIDVIVELLAFREEYKQLYENEKYEKNKSRYNLILDRLEIITIEEFNQSIKK